MTNRATFSVYYQQASYHVFHSAHQSLEAAERTAYYLEMHGHDVSVIDTNEVGGTLYSRGRMLDPNNEYDWMLIEQYG